MAEWVNVRVELLVLVVAPSCSHCNPCIRCGLFLLFLIPVSFRHTGQILEVLEVLVAVTVLADEGTSLGVTCAPSVAVAGCRDCCTSYPCTIAAKNRVSRRSLRVIREIRRGGRTCIWWPYS